MISRVFLVKEINTQCYPICHFLSWVTLSSTEKDIASWIHCTIIFKERKKENLEKNECLAAKAPTLQILNP